MVTAYFVDSSALVKRYVSEMGTTWLQSALDPQTHNPTIIARATWVEVLSAFARRQREGMLLPNQVAQAVRVFRYDLDTQYQVVELDRAIADMAGQLVGRYPLRAYDAIQLASALCLLPVFACVSSTSLVFLSAVVLNLRSAVVRGWHRGTDRREPRPSLLRTQSPPATGWRALATLRAPLWAWAES
jgi:predicted nucleic acid-binding protein